jgi:adenylate cyclase
MRPPAHFPCRPSTDVGSWVHNALMPSRRRSMRSSITVRLLAGFVIVVFIPIVVLATLSLTEAAAEPGPEGSGLAETDEHGALAGVPVAFVELGVAGVSLVLAIGTALYFGRTIIRPLRELETAMHRVESGDLDATAGVTSDDEIGHLAAAFNRMVGGLKREALVRDLFGQYVSPQVARLAIAQEGGLEGQVIESTVLFVDIRRFTGLAEVMPPARLIGTLNRYFERMLVVVENEGGIVNKFGGDSLLAIFGSPLNPSPDHAERAVRASLGMRVALAEFNREQAEAEMPKLHVGFGLATGELVAGNVGSDRKLEYTVIGDPVNLAARLQELTPELGVSILMSAETARRAQAVARLRSHGEIEVRGRAERVEVFSAEALLPGDQSPIADSSVAMSKVSGFPRGSHSA